MIHYSCDRCKRVIQPADDVRYIVRMEVQAVVDSGDGNELDEDRDHLLEIHELLERADDGEFVDEFMYQKRRYDLCPECCRKFLQAPVGSEATTSLGFSQN